MPRLKQLDSMEIILNVFNNMRVFHLMKVNKKEQQLLIIVLI